MKKKIQKVIVFSYITTLLKIKKVFTIIISVQINLIKNLMVFNNYFFLLQSFVAAFMLAGGFFGLVLYLGDRRVRSNFYLSLVSFVFNEQVK